jgi:4-amino-4-deoxy-L-arabinose transferase-like glycosyltransferase
MSKPGPRSAVDRWFKRWVGVAALGGFGIRVANALALPKTGLSDATFYHLQANLLAKGDGFANSFVWVSTGRLTPSAVHPPLYPMVLSVSSVLGGTSLLAHRITSGGIGVVTIVAVALIAREVAGSAVGSLAAIFAAVYPNLWGLEGSLMSESLAAALVAVSLLLALRLVKNPSLPRAVILAVVIALASLTRPETLLLVPILAIPIAWTRRSLSQRRRITLVASVLMAAGIVIAPWMIRNLVGFSRPVVFSTNGDEVIGVANCRDAYYTPAFVGYWFVGCAGPTSPVDDAKNTAIARTQGLHYLKDHLHRFFGTVVWARLGRVADVYRPFENARYSAQEGRRLGVAYAGLWAYWACLPFALVGGIVLRRRNRADLRILLSPVVVVIVTAIYAYGAVRFRAIAEPSLLVLAAVGVTACWQHLRAPSQSRLSRIAES